MVISHQLKFAFLLLLVVAAFMLANIIPYEVKSFCYAVSLSIKEVLVFILPFIVFSIVFHSMSQLRGGYALKAAILLLVMVGLSNSVSVLVAHVLGMRLMDSAQHALVTDIAGVYDLRPIYETFSLPKLVSSAKALLAGFFCGIVLPMLIGTKACKVSKFLHDSSVLILDKIFAPILPIFIVGFAFKIHSEGALSVIASNTHVMLYASIPALIHVILLYFISNGASLKATFVSIRNMLPAALTGFSTMSSLLTMPITLAGVKKNTNNSIIADIVVPGSVNIHLVGDCFFSVILLLLMSSTFGTEVITTSDYIHFLVYAVLMKFAEAAVAGTGLILMFPVMEQYLHFSPTMLSLATTLYILVDPIITVINVLGNGAFSMLFIKVNKSLFKKDHSFETQK